ncbi:MAG: hypothetical protein KKA78_09455 [Alphaproteobacteria bacterium]|nr:hypothetical protein [Alphaproteobacteria bacterium]
MSDQLGEIARIDRKAGWNPQIDNDHKCRLGSVIAHLRAGDDGIVFFQRLAIVIDFEFDNFLLRSGNTLPRHVIPGDDLIHDIGVSLDFEL